MTKTDAGNQTVRYEQDEIPTFYSNIAQAVTSPYDVILRFGRRKLETERAEGVTISDAIQVYMSPQHARAVMALLERQLADYEERYGPIPGDRDPAPGDSSQ